MRLRGRLKKLAREAEREMVVFELVDGTTACFHQDEFLDCFVHEMERGRRHCFGEDPGSAHPIIEALRKVSDEEMARVVRDHGMLLGDLVGEDEIIRGLKERPGPPVRETSPGVMNEPQIDLRIGRREPLGNLVRRLERLERELERARGLTSPLHWSAAGKI